MQRRTERGEIERREGTRDTEAQRYAGRHKDGVTAANLCESVLRSRTCPTCCTSRRSPTPDMEWARVSERGGGEADERRKS